MGNRFFDYLFDYSKTFPLWFPMFESGFFPLNQLKCLVQAKSKMDIRFAVPSSLPIASVLAYSQRTFSVSPGNQSIALSIGLSEFTPSSFHPSPSLFLGTSCLVQKKEDGRGKELFIQSNDLHQPNY